MNVHERIQKGRAWECWPATVGVAQNGYATWYADGRSQGAHRISYQAFIGPIPEGLTIDHRCNNPTCVNPFHLEPETLRDNIYRSDINPLVRNAKKTHCIRGHEFDDDNTLIDKHGYRRCRVCQLAKNQRQMYARRHQKASESQRSCEVDGCDLIHLAKGMCGVHYQRQYHATRGAA